MTAMEKLLELSGWRGREKDSGEMFYTHPHSGVDYRFPIAALMLLYSIRTVSPPPQIKTACKAAFEEIIGELQKAGWEVENNQAIDPEHSSLYSFEIEEAFVIQALRSAYPMCGDFGFEPPGLN